MKTARMRQAGAGLLIGILAFQTAPAADGAADMAILKQTSRAFSKIASKATPATHVDSSGGLLE